MTVLTAHWDASTLGLASGATVTTWPDATGIQGALTPSNGSPPTYVTNAHNGLGVVDLATSGDTMDSTWTLVPGTRPQTLIIVGRLTSLVSVSLWFHQTFSLTFFTNGSVWDMVSGVDLTGGTPDTAIHVFTMMFNGLSSVLKVDGVTIASGNSGSSATTGFVNQIKGPFRWAEIFFYDGDATGDGIENGLIQKWITPKRRVAAWSTRASG